MKRVLSLLLLVPFLTVQAWALRGGPFDGLNGRSQAALAGTYGVVLSGKPEDGRGVLLNEEGKADKANPPVNPETTGIMAMSIPAAGLASGRVLIFSQGLMYLGNAQGVVDQRSGTMTLVSQVSHYVAHVVSDGIQKQSGVVVDAILSGKMDLTLSLDYFSGLIEVVGGATYYKADPMLAQVVLDTNTSTAVNNAVSNQNKNENQVSNLNSSAGQTATAGQNANSTTTSTAGQGVQSNQTASATQTSATNSSEDKSLNQTSTSSTNGTVTNPDGSITTNSDSTGSTSNSLTGSSTGSNAVSSQTQSSDVTKKSDTTDATTKTQTSTTAATSDLTKGSTVTAGTAVTVGTTQNSTNSVTTTKYRPDLVRQAPIALSFMKLAATGVREDSTVAVLAPFAPPTEATSFQIEVAAPAATGGGTGGTAPRPGA